MPPKKKAKPSHKGLRHTLADRLATDIENSVNKEFGTIDMLAHHYNVSRSTMLRAARILRSKGIVDFGRGRRVQKTGMMQQEHLVEIPEYQRPSQQVAGELERKISEGFYKTGDCLPKIQYFV
ncbi:MAG: hypothetical protein GF350_04435, partial [Chitinivibrionales bacterium]|nr:hypothetical protein [Chitinivibrionales bacterium]